MNYTTLSRAFAEIKDVSILEVGRMIGGKVQFNTEAGHFENACAIRLSYALNKAGVDIRFSDGSGSEGADGKWYLYKVADLEKVIQRVSGKVITGENLSDLQGRQGIIISRNCGWGNSRGYIDLYNGLKVEGDAHSHEYGKIVLYVV